MTTRSPQPGGGSNALARVWARFTRWRRQRPFWGGLFTMLSGLEIFATTQGSLGGLSFQMGPTGYMSWLLPAILLTCGLLIWFSPAQRMFYAVVAAVTAVFSLIGVNLGGFFLGLILGVVGSALAFGWSPVIAKPAAATDTPTPDEDGTAPPADPPADDRHPPATMDQLFTGPLTGPLTDTLPPPRNPLHDPAPAGAQHGQPADRHGPWHPARDEPTGVLPTVSTGNAAEPKGTVYGGGRPAHLGDAPPSPPAAPRRPVDGVPPVDPPPGAYGTPRSDDDGSGPFRRHPGALALIFVMLSIAAVAVSTVPGGTPASAAPCPTPTPSTTTAAPADTPSAASSASAGTPPLDEKPVGSIIGGIVGGVRDLLGIEDPKAAAPDPTPTAATPATPTTTPTATPSASRSATPTPTAPGTDCDGTDDGKLGPSPKPGQVKKLNAPAGFPPVANFSRLTGSKLTMLWMETQGVVELPKVGGGTVKVLKFTMDEAVTDDFLMRSPTGDGHFLVTKSKKLTVRWDEDGKPEPRRKVAFYASRFTGELVVIPGVPGFTMTLTPERPLPALPLPLGPRLVFKDADLELVHVDTQELSAVDLVQTRI